MKKTKLIIIAFIVLGITLVGNQAYAVHLSSSGTGQANTYTQTQTFTGETLADGGIASSQGTDLTITTNPAGNDNISVSPGGTGKIRVDGEKISSKSGGAVKKDLTIEAEDGTDPELVRMGVDQEYYVVESIPQVKIIKAIQEQQSIIEDLQAENDSLKTDRDSLNEKLDLLFQLVCFDHPNAVVCRN